MNFQLQISFWGLKLLNDSTFEGVIGNKPKRLTHSGVGQVWHLLLECSGCGDMNEIRHPDQINPCRKIVTQQGPVMLVIWHPVSVDILASLVWRSVRAVYSQTQISRTKHRHYAEAPLRSTLSCVLNLEAHLSQVCFSLIIQQQPLILFKGLKLRKFLCLQCLCSLCLSPSVSLLPDTRPNSVHGKKKKKKCWSDRISADTVDVKGQRYGGAEEGR